MRETFGRRLKQRRKELGLTQDKLGLLTGLSQTNITFYETEKREPGLFNAICIADALGVSLDWLAGRTDKKGN